MSMKMMPLLLAMEYVNYLDRFEYSKVEPTLNLKGYFMLFGRKTFAHLIILWVAQQKHQSFENLLQLQLVSWSWYSSGKS